MPSPLWPSSPSNYEKIRRRYSNPLERYSFPAQVLAQKALDRAVENGTIQPIEKMRCVHCGANASQYIWPEGYSTENWLNVEPVCPRHSPTSP